MKLHSVAALTLVGWYLMAPPLNSDLKVNYHALLSQWVLVASYDRAAECEKERTRRLKQAAAEPIKDSTTALLEFSEASNSVCIASDDPRLKEKSEPIAKSSPTPDAP